MRTRGAQGYRRAIAKCGVVAALVAAALWGGTPASADDKGEKAAAISRSMGDAVVHVKVVMKYRIAVGGREVRNGENEVEAVGTVIDPAGLTVLSNTNVDPTKAYADMLKKARPGGEDPGTIDIDGSFTDVRIRLGDGSELPARVILRDKDLDLVFVRPSETPPKALAYVDLAKDGKPAMLDELVVLGRMGAIGGRAPSASLFRIEAVVRKPRSYYLIDQNAVSGRLGSPAFTLDGKVAGILLLRAMDAQEGGTGPLEMVFGGISRMGLYPVILPAEEVASVAMQAGGKGSDAGQTGGPSR